jgi:UDP-N-acetylglucosamine 1-carboxyvinyltransferase
MFMSDQVFIVKGGNQLNGSIIPQGAKNEVLQIICAVLLTEETVTISNIPMIVDVLRLIDLLVLLGVKAEKTGPNSYTFNAKDVSPEHFSNEEFHKNATKIRGSVMLLGPLLARFGKAFLPKPGGDKIGRRRLDAHFIGFKSMGADYKYDKKTDNYFLECKSLKGQFVYMDEISVTGTANMIMAAVLAKGHTEIYNAACEPYIQQLCKMLNSMGARISGIGSNFLKIEGVKSLGGTHHRVLPDMIEIGSFIGMAAMTQSALTIKDASLNDLGIIPRTFEKMGIGVEQKGDDIYVPKLDQYEIQSFIDGSILTLYDAPWPGFTPDLISIMLTVATQAKGSVLIHQKMFESRLFFVDKLIDMGAQIILCDPHRATVIGIDRKYKLRGIHMSSPDIRAGVALLLAALSAEGESVIHNISQIDRGYQKIEERLKSIGADIRREQM